MASSNKTPHYNLSQFAPTDKPAWQGDYNADMKKIDNGIYAAQNKADRLDASVSEATNKATQALEKAEAAEDAAENAAALAQEAKTTADNISADVSDKVSKSGDTMTGPLVLSGDPTQPMEAATKQYVDQHGGGGASGDAGGSTPVASVTLNPNLFLKFGNMVFLNTTLTIPQKNANATLFTIPYPNLSGKKLTTSLTIIPPTSSGTDASTLTATVSQSNIAIKNNEDLGAGTYAINGWILIREE